MSRKSTRYDRHLRSAFGPAHRCPWRFFVTVYFALYLNYVPFHLATENHVGERDSWAKSQTTALSATIPASHDDSDHHIPHSGSDHALQILRQAPSFSVDLDIAPPEACLYAPPPGECCRALLLVREHPPNSPHLGRPHARDPPLA